MTTPRDDISGLIDGWSCNERNRSADSCRNPCGCHCREITALQARVKELDEDAELLSDMVVKEEDCRKMWQARALRAEQERDEAYKLAAGIIDAECESILSKQTPTNDPLSMEYAVNQNLRLIAFILPDLSAAILRLAGPEKEGE